MKKKRATGNRMSRRNGLSDRRDVWEDDFDENGFEDDDFEDDDGFEDDDDFEGEDDFEEEDSVAEEDDDEEDADDIWDEDDELEEELVLPPQKSVVSQTAAGVATEAKEGSHIAYAKRQKRKLGLMEIGMLVGGIVIAAVLVFLLVNMFGGRRAAGQQTSQSGFSADALIAVQSIGNDGIASATNRAERELAEQLAKEQENQNQDLPDVTDPEPEEDPVEEKQDIYATLNLTSIEKDLKIKFMNAKTRKLIAGVAFVVDLESKDGQKYSFTNENKDGILHKTDLKPGTYKVKVQAVDGYTFDKNSYSIVIKDQIEYAEVDVTGEVKTENEVDSSKEDTAQKEEQEVVLKDTVEWVESTKTPLNGGSAYREIDKGKIVNPETVVTIGNRGSGSGYLLMTELTDNYVTGVSISANGGGTDLSLNDTVTLTATVSGVGEECPTTVTWSSSDPALATVTDGTVKMISEVEADTPITITATSTGYAQDGENHISETFTVTLKAKTVAPVHAAAVTLDSTTGKLTVGAEMTLTATLQYDDNSSVNGATTGKVTFTSSDDAIATVTPEGVVTAKKAGEVTITATSLEQDAQGEYPKATCVITVGNASVSLTIEEKKLIYMNQPLNIIATIVLNGVSTKIDGSADTAGLVTWLSSDPNIATVDAATGLIQPVKKGTFTLTATSVAKDAEGKTVSATCMVTVMTDPKTDTTTPLKDESGNQIYILKDNAYVEAASADYYTAEKFYIKGDVQYMYTGWQVFGEYTYFYDKSGNMVTGEQVINGVKYTFREDGRLDTGNAVLGIDVSRYNGTINWTKVKESGVNFVIIRCGYRGSTQGALVEDLNFKTNIKGATEAGLKVGVYFFSQAITEVEAVEEASMVLSLVKGYKLAYPIFIDTEPSGGRGDKMNAEQRTKVCKAFCQTIQNAGYSAGIYASKYYFNNHLIASQLSAYKIWVAQYNTTCTYAGKYDMWQFSSTGNISGISGNVDLNYSYGL